MFNQKYLLTLAVVIDISFGNKISPKHDLPTVSYLISIAISMKSHLEWYFIVVEANEPTWVITKTSQNEL